MDDPLSKWMGEIVVVCQKLISVMPMAVALVVLPLQTQQKATAGDQILSPSFSSQFDEVPPADNQFTTYRPATINAATTTDGGNLIEQVGAICSNECGETGCGEIQSHVGFGGATDCIDRWLPRANVPIPFYRELAAGSGQKLPLPIGVGIINTQLERQIGVSDIRIGVGGNTPVSASRFTVADLTANASSTIARVDAWILPCLNVYGLVGHTRSKTTVFATVSDFPTPGSPDLTLPIDVLLKGTSKGGGVTAAMGAGDYVATLNVNYTMTDFDSLSSELETLVIAPRFGRTLDGPWYKGEVHIGAMYQKTTQTVEVMLDRPILGPLEIQIDQFEPRKWNFLVGTLWAVSERFHVVVEGGFGGRQYVISGATLRF